MNGIKKETFQGYSVESKLDTLFDYIHAIYEKSCVDDDALDKRVTVLENRKRFDTVAATGGGVFGGILAVMGKWFFFK